MDAKLICWGRAEVGINSQRLMLVTKIVGRRMQLLKGVGVEFKPAVNLRRAYDALTESLMDFSIAKSRAQTRFC